MTAGVASVEAATVSLLPQAVYNLEVAGQHVYQIGFSGVLVHNNGQNYEELADAAKSGSRWIGSELSHEATQEAADSMARRISSLRAGADEAIEEVVHVGSRKTGWSAKNNRGPLSTSDVDIAVSDWPWLKGSRHEARVLKKMRAIADEFEEATGLTVELHLRSRYSRQQWGEFFGEYFI